MHKENNRILITGGLGFIGSNLAKRLVKEGFDITILDSMYTGTMDNIYTIGEEINLIISKEFNPVGKKYDVIFHQGMYSSSPMYLENPKFASEIISQWLQILEYCKKNKTKLIYASSSSLYNGNPVPYKEDMPIYVKDIYTEARYAIERFAELYHNLYGLKSVGLRYFSVYGPNEKSKGKYANLVSQFLWDLKAGRSPVIYGNGNQSRDFIHIDDVVKANILAMEYPEQGIFNVGTGTSYTINDMASILSTAMKINLEPIYQKVDFKNYVEHTRADTSKAEYELGFRAGISLEEGIKRLIK